jgi:hypothetical protein
VKYGEIRCRGPHFSAASELWLGNWQLANAMVQRLASSEPKHTDTAADTDHATNIQTKLIFSWSFLELNIE